MVYGPPSLLQGLATDPLSLSKSEITIFQVTAKRSRLVIDGEMTYESVKVPFNYRTSIGVKGNVSSPPNSLRFVGVGSSPHTVLAVS